jgi:hypothetical protein
VGFRAASPQPAVEAVLREFLAKTNVIVETDRLPAASPCPAPVRSCASASRIAISRPDALAPSLSEKTGPCTSPFLARQPCFEFLHINQLHWQFFDSAHNARLFAQAKQFDFANHFINSVDYAAAPRGQRLRPSSAFSGGPPPILVHRRPGSDFVCHASCYPGRLCRPAIGENSIRKT